MLISFLALLSNYDRENCLINVGTEGEVREKKGSGPNHTGRPGVRGLGVRFWEVPTRSRHSEVAWPAGNFTAATFAIASSPPFPKHPKSGITAAS